MPTLVSPGVSVTVSDESQYAAATQGTLPLLVVATMLAVLVSSFLVFTTLSARAIVENNTSRWQNGVHVVIFLLMGSSLLGTLNSFHYSISKFLFKVKIPVFINF